MIATVELGSIAARIASLEAFLTLTAQCRCDSCFQLALAAERRIVMLRTWLP